MYIVIVSYYSASQQQNIHGNRNNPFERIVVSNLSLLKIKININLNGNVMVKVFIDRGNISMLSMEDIIT